MENKKQKGILYTLCFACIMLIDWSRGSLPWHFWAASLNVTGVVMAIVMASHFTWKGQAVKKYMLWLTTWLAGSIAGYFWWRTHPGEVLFLQYVSAAVMIGCLGVVGIRIWQERKLLQQFSVGPPFLVSIWAILSVLMLFSRFSELWPIWFLVMFGMFYVIPYSGEERESLWDGLANGVILGFFLIQIFAYGFRPYDEIRYKGAYSNCNVNALMYLVAYIMVLYRIHSMFWREKTEGSRAARKRHTKEAVEKVQRSRVLWKIFYLLLAAGLFCFIIFTMTRTAILAAIALTLAFGVLEIFFLKNRGLHRILVDGATFCICVVLLFPCVYMTIRYLPTILHHPIWWDGEYSEEKVHSFDPYDSEKYVSLEEVLGEVLGRFGFALEAEAAPSITEDAEALLTDEEKQLLTGEAAQSSGRIRLEIYKRYLRHMNLTGHTLTEGYFPITEDYHAWHAQNIFLQVGFYHGIPAGICFVVLMLSLGVYYFRLVIRGKRREDILPLLVWMLFVGFGMLECVWYLGQSILFLMYLVPKMLVDSKREEKV